MNLEFKKVGNRYEAEFEATGDFNLHIEREKKGNLAIFQKTSADDNYASESFYSDNAEPIENKDFSRLIYPKFIKVVSGSNVIKATVTMEGKASEGAGSGLKIVPLTNQCEILYTPDPAAALRPLELGPDGIIPEDLHVAWLVIKSLNFNFAGFMAQIDEQLWSNMGRASIYCEDRTPVGYEFIDNEYKGFQGLKLEYIEGL